MKRKNNCLRFALVGLSTIALSSGSVQAADFGQLAQVVGGQVALAAPYLTNLRFLGMLAQFFGGAQSAVVDPYYSVDFVNALENETLHYSVGVSDLGDAAQQLFDGKEVSAAAQKGIDLVEGTGYKALQLAFEGDTGPLRELLKAGVNINAVNEMGLTALIMAVAQQDIAIVKILLQAGANVNAVDGYDVLTAPIIAVMRGDAGIIELLVSAGADLIQAAYLGDETIVAQMIRAGVNVNMVDQDGRPALIYVAATGNVAIVELLLNARANVNAFDKEGRTALMWAAMCKYIAIVKLLLADAKTQVNVVDEFNRTALIYAAGKGYTAIVKLLLDAGADMYIVDANGKTALDWAVENGHKEIVGMLQNGGKQVGQVLSADQQADWEFANNGTDPRSY